MSNDGTIPKKNKLTFENVKFQFLASVCANIVVLAHGCSVGWLSPAVLVLLSDDSPLVTGKISLAEAGWIGSGLSIGGVVGVLLIGALAVFIGNKRSMLLCALPITSFWFIVLFAQYPWHLSIGRIVTGLTGATFLCFQFFIAEIADPRIRGALSALLTVKFNIGILLGYIAGTHLEWYTQCYVMMLIPVVFFALFSFFPESPQHFLKIEQVENAEKSLRFYRNCKVGSDNDLELQLELEKFKEIAERNKSEEGVKLEDFFNPTSLRALSIAPALMAVSQFGGTFTLVSYAGTIFKESGSNLNPNYSSIILGILQILGTISTYFLIDRIGRRALLAISTGGAAIGLTIMGIYCYLGKHQPNVDVSQYYWIPVVSLSFVIYVASVGITPIQYIIISEVIPQKIKRIGGPICMCTVGVYAAIMLKIFPSMLVALDLYGCMFVFAFVNVLGILFVKFIVPETKGRNLDVLEGPENETYITRL